MEDKIMTNTVSKSLYNNHYNLIDNNMPLIIFSSKTSLSSFIMPQYGAKKPELLITKEMRVPHRYVF